MVKLMVEMHEKFGEYHHHYPAAGWWVDEAEAEKEWSMYESEEDD